METTSRTQFSTVRTEGAILPADLLQRVVSGDGLEGARPEDYHLLEGERINEAVSRAWKRCQVAWERFDRERETLSPGDTGTTLTRERWLLPLFQELGYGRLQGAAGMDVDGVHYPISHLWGRAPIHLVTFRQRLDRTSDIATAVKRSPHGLMQEFLNRSEGYLWGIISNGLALRILRDNASLTRAAYVEFDLEALMRGEQYADFTLLWMLCHQSRVEGEDPREFWLERWSQEAAEAGTRALDGLRDGVRQAIGCLGSGFLGRRAGAPLNPDLVERLRSGALSVTDYYRQLLRLVYRLIVLTVAEDRELLLVPGATERARDTYERYYSLRRLRDLAGGHRGTAHADLYHGLCQVFALLREGYEPLGMPALGGYLFGSEATPDLDAAEIANRDLLAAIRELAYTVQGSVRRAVDYRNLGAEELGSVYESLLELHPELHVEAGAFALHEVAGSERKTTGSYYTPTSLIQSLLDTALEPVIASRLTDHSSRITSPASRITDHASLSSALLSIRVVDPACGSGHFLIAAAHRLARRLAQVRTGEEEPGPPDLRAALREVVTRCIHGVDLNPMAVELCKVALWMETLDPGKPLSFLDANIQCGNSLLGATPALLREGIPDGAFTPITGDDRAYCSEWRKKNREERESGQLSLNLDSAPWEHLGDLAANMAAFAVMADDTAGDVQAKEELYAELVRSQAYTFNRLWADAWCAAFVWHKTPACDYPITEGLFRTLEHNPYSVAPWVREEIGRLAAQYRFFHWHLAFPQVFGPEGEGGFDVVLGNPPWERTRLVEKEWFAARNPDIANSPNAAARQAAINSLLPDDSALHREFMEAQRKIEALSGFIRHSGRYPFTGKGQVNTYAVFAEMNRDMLGDGGRAGFIIQSDIATSDNYKEFFADLLERRQLASFYDFVNTEGIFPAVHRTHPHFCLVTLSQAGDAGEADFAFWNTQVEQLAADDRHFTLSLSDLAILNPNTRNCPIFSTQRDAKLTKAVHASVPVLVNEAAADGNPWGVQFFRMFDMAGDSDLFRTRREMEERGWTVSGSRYDGEGTAYLPLYEPKYVHQFDHRYAVYESDRTRTLSDAEKYSPCRVVEPLYWVPEPELKLRSGGKTKHAWLVGWRGVSNTTNERTIIAAVLPLTGVGHNYQLLTTTYHPALLLANLNSYILDFVARQKIGTAFVAYFVMKQLPLLPPACYSSHSPWAPSEPLERFVLQRVLELSYTAWDLGPFARDCGYEGPPFRWDDERRFLLRCELDAAFFHLYGIPREDVGYIMETFPIVRRKDEAAHGEYRTKRVILEIYDEMARAMATGEPYRTRLDPPPADPSVAHGWESKPEWVE